VGLVLCVLLLAGLGAVSFRVPRSGGRRRSDSGRSDCSRVVAWLVLKSLARRQTMARGKASANGSRSPTAPRFFCTTRCWGTRHRDAAYREAHPQAPRTDEHFSRCSTLSRKSYEAKLERLVAEQRSGQRVDPILARDRRHEMRKSLTTLRAQAVCPTRRGIAGGRERATPTSRPPRAPCATRRGPLRW